MQGAIRGQNDVDNQELFSDESGVDFTDADDNARQEFKDEADINYILKRFSLTPQGRQNPIFAETDYTTGLQDAIDAVAQAKAVHLALNPKLRSKYPTWQHMLNAIAAGELDLQKDPEPAPPAPPPA